MLKVAELNALDGQEFAAALAGIFENSRWIPTKTASQRPFTSRDKLHAALCDTVMKASDNEKLSLIRAHPDLVGSATLTAESRGEQAAAGLGKLSPDEITRFQKYNAEYRER